jgi:hypothetical protein
MWGFNTPRMGGSEMFRLFVVLLAMLGAGVLLSSQAPSSHEVAFTFEGISVTYIVIVVLLVGFIGVKVTK